MGKTKEIAALLIVVAVLLCGCGEDNLSIAKDTEDVSVNKEINNPTETEAKTEYEQANGADGDSGEMQTIDGIKYNYGDSCEIRGDLFKSDGDEKPSFIASINCDKSGCSFASLCYMKLLTKLLSATSIQSFHITLENEGEGCSALGINGQIIQESGELDTESISATEDDVDKSIEFSGLLDEFMTKNGMN